MFCLTRTTSDPPTDTFQRTHKIARDRDEAREIREKVCGAALSLLLACLESGALPEGDELLSLWTALQTALERLSWKERIVVCKCIDRALENTTQSVVDARRDFADSVAASFGTLASALAALVEESKQSSVRLAALNAVVRLVKADDLLPPPSAGAPGRVGADLDARLRRIAAVASGDSDVHIAESGASLASALAARS